MDLQRQTRLGVAAFACCQQETERDCRVSELVPGPVLVSYCSARKVWKGLASHAQQPSLTGFRSSLIAKWNTFKDEVKTEITVCCNDTPSHDLTQITALTRLEKQTIFSSDFLSAAFASTSEFLIRSRHGTGSALAGRVIPPSHLHQLTCNEMPRHKRVIRVDRETLMVTLMSSKGTRPDKSINKYS